jgi:hypothetical protein
MTSCSTNTCGVGGWNGPLPGDPDNNVTLTATPAFGGIDVAWTYPSTNPHAVAFVKLYRGILPNFATAIKLATVSGDQFYDKSTSAELVQYYYWISIVSVNGTEGALIGPASAIAKPPIATVIEGLSAQIDDGMLSQSLRTELGRISLNYTEYLTEVNARVATNTAFSNLLTQVQTDLGSALSLVSQEITQRQEGDSALVLSLSTVASANADNYALIQENYYTKVDADQAVTNKLVDYVTSSGLSTTLNSYASKAFLTENHYTKTQSDSAISLATQNLVSTTSLGTTLESYTNTAALQTDYYTKTETNSAISSATSTLVATTTLGNYSTTAAINTKFETKVGYAVKVEIIPGNVPGDGMGPVLPETEKAVTPFDGDGVTVVYPAITYPEAFFPVYALDRKKIIDKVGVDNWNATLATPLNPFGRDTFALRWVEGLPLATAISNIQVTDSDGNMAALQQAFVAQKDLNNNFKAQYTAKVSITDGTTQLIGGFGIYGDETGIEAGFDVDRFWIGDTAENKIKPFIVEEGVVYITEAAIEKLTFNKLRDESGSFIVEDGKIKADYLNVKTLVSTAPGGDVELGQDVGPGTGHYGLSLSGDDFNDIFMKRNDGVKFFRVNSGGANSITFDSESGNLNITANLTARSFSTIGGRFTADSSGNVIADRVSIRRRDSVANGSGYWGTELSTVTTLYDSKGNSYQGYSGEVSSTFWIDTGIDDYDFASLYTNQKYGAIVSFSNGYVWWNGSGGITGEAYSVYVDCEVRVRSTHYISGTTPGTYATPRVWIYVKLRVANIATNVSVTKIRLDNYQWGIFKL